MDIFLSALTGATYPLYGKDNGKSSSGRKTSSYNGSSKNCPSTAAQNELLRVLTNPSSQEEIVLSPTILIPLVNAAEHISERFHHNLNMLAIMVKNINAIITMEQQACKVLQHCASEMGSISPLDNTSLQSQLPYGVMSAYSYSLLTKVESKQNYINGATDLVNLLVGVQNQYAKALEHSDGLLKDLKRLVKKTQTYPERTRTSILTSSRILESLIASYFRAEPTRCKMASHCLSQLMQLSLEFDAAAVEDQRVTVNNTIEICEIAESEVALSTVPYNSSHKREASPGVSPDGLRTSTADALTASDSNQVSGTTISPQQQSGGVLHRFRIPKDCNPIVRRILGYDPVEDDDEDDDADASDDDDVVSRASNSAQPSPHNSTQPEDGQTETDISLFGSEIAQQTDKAHQRSQHRRYNKHSSAMSLLEKDVSDQVYSASMLIAQFHTYAHLLNLQTQARQNQLYLRHLQHQHEQQRKEQLHMLYKNNIFYLYPIIIPFIVPPPYYSPRYELLCKTFCLCSFDQESSGDDHRCPGRSGDAHDSNAFLSQPADHGDSIGAGIGLNNSQDDDRISYSTHRDGHNQALTPHNLHYHYCDRFDEHLLRMGWYRSYHLVHDRPREVRRQLQFYQQTPKQSHYPARSLYNPTTHDNSHINANPAGIFSSASHTGEQASTTASTPTQTDCIIGIDHDHFHQQSSSSDSQMVLDNHYSLLESADGVNSETHTANQMKPPSYTHGVSSAAGDEHSPPTLSTHPSALGGGDRATYPRANAFNHSPPPCTGPCNAYTTTFSPLTISFPSSSAMPRPSIPLHMGSYPVPTTPQLLYHNYMYSLSHNTLLSPHTVSPSSSIGSARSDFPSPSGVPVQPMLSIAVPQSPSSQADVMAPCTLTQVYINDTSSQAANVLSTAIANLIAYLCGTSFGPTQEEYQPFTYSYAIVQSYLLALPILHEHFDAFDNETVFAPGTSSQPEFVQMGNTSSLPCLDDSPSTASTYNLFTDDLLLLHLRPAMIPSYRRLYTAYLSTIYVDNEDEDGDHDGSLQDASSANDDDENNTHNPVHGNSTRLGHGNDNEHTQSSTHLNILATAHPRSRQYIYSNSQTSSTTFMVTTTNSESQSSHETTSDSHPLTNADDEQTQELETPTSSPVRYPQGSVSFRESPKPTTSPHQTGANTPTATLFHTFSFSGQTGEEEGDHIPIPYGHGHYLSTRLGYSHFMCSSSTVLQALLILTCSTVGRQYISRGFSVLRGIPGFGSSMHLESRNSISQLVTLTEIMLECSHTLSETASLSSLIMVSQSLQFSIGVLNPFIDNTPYGGSNPLLSPSGTHRHTKQSTSKKKSSEKSKPRAKQQQASGESTSDASTSKHRHNAEAVEGNRPSHVSPHPSRGVSPQHGQDQTAPVFHDLLIAEQIPSMKDDSSQEQSKKTTVSIDMLDLNDPASDEAILTHSADDVPPNRLFDSIIQVGSKQYQIIVMTLFDLLMFHPALHDCHVFTGLAILSSTRSIDNTIRGEQYWKDFYAAVALHQKHQLALVPRYIPQRKVNVYFSQRVVLNAVSLFSLDIHSQFTRMANMPSLGLSTSPGGAEMAGQLHSILQSILSHLASARDHQAFYASVLKHMPMVVSRITSQHPHASGEHTGSPERVDDDPMQVMVKLLRLVIWHCLRSISTLLLIQDANTLSPLCGDIFVNAPPPVHSSATIDLSGFHHIPSNLDSYDETADDYSSSSHSDTIRKSVHGSHPTDADSPTNEQDPLTPKKQFTQWFGDLVWPCTLQYAQQPHQHQFTPTTADTSGVGSSPNPLATLTLIHSLLPPSLPCEVPLQRIITQSLSSVFSLSGVLSTLLVCPHCISNFGHTTLRLLTSACSSAMDCSIPCVMPHSEDPADTEARADGRSQHGIIPPDNETHHLTACYEMNMTAIATTLSQNQDSWDQHIESMFPPSPGDASLQGLILTNPIASQPPTPGVTPTPTPRLASRPFEGPTDRLPVGNGALSNDSNNTQPPHSRKNKIMRTPSSLWKKKAAVLPKNVTGNDPQPESQAANPASPSKQAQDSVATKRGGETPSTHSQTPLASGSGSAYTYHGHDTPTPPGSGHTTPSLLNTMSSVGQAPWDLSHLDDGDAGLEATSPQAVNCSCYRLWPNSSYNSDQLFTLSLATFITYILTLSLYQEKHRQLACHLDKWRVHPLFLAYLDYSTRTSQPPSTPLHCTSFPSVFLLLSPEQFDLVMEAVQHHITPDTFDLSLLPTASCYDQTHGVPKPTYAKAKRNLLLKKQHKSLDILLYGTSHPGDDQDESTSGSTPLFSSVSGRQQLNHPSGSDLTPQDTTRNTDRHHDLGMDNTTLRHQRGTPEVNYLQQPALGAQTTIIVEDTITHTEDLNIANPYPTRPRAAAQLQRSPPVPHQQQNDFAQTKLTSLGNVFVDSDDDDPVAQLTTMTTASPPPIHHQPPIPALANSPGVNDLLSSLDHIDVVVSHPQGGNTSRRSSAAHDMMRVESFNGQSVTSDNTTEGDEYHSQYNPEYHSSSFYETLDDQQHTPPHHPAIGQPQTSSQENNLDFQSPPQLLASKSNLSALSYAPARSTVLGRQKSLRQDEPDAHQSSNRQLYDDALEHSPRHASATTRSGEHRRDNQNRPTTKDSGLESEGSSAYSASTLSSRSSFALTKTPPRTKARRSQGVLSYEMHSMHTNDGDSHSSVSHTDDLE